VKSFCSTSIVMSCSEVHQAPGIYAGMITFRAPVSEARPNTSWPRCCQQVTFALQQSEVQAMQTVFGDAQTVGD